MKITILSGKGGTGKTTVSTNLAYVLSKKYKVQLLDVDVEEPNDYLFFDVTFEKEESVDILLPVVDNDKCIKCGECSRACQFGAISVFPNSTVVFKNLCHGCGACTMVCPVNAIKEVPKSIGKIKLGRINENLKFGMGLLNIGEPSGVRIIRQLKKHIDESFDVILIDSQPGTSCPVVESLRNVDFAILVTEPTTFGLHDLSLAVDLVKEMKIPAAIVVNRDTNRSNLIDEYAKRENIPIGLKIPFDKKIARLYSEGKIFAQHLPEWEGKFLDFFNAIKEMIK
ncbi:(4Fe-4S)-binding protein [Thermosipho melanesiensis]|uniref:Cobyrinic acid a,c-diamide synthase n=2 Tax=Thermosipho melanesiensis TaxID=46541 RepID=A6LIZ2_THEM4|nr:ATP-binding protein [Thermosipho melanesiensis]ABR29893.1 Cobyrinic acid a,c-diamide synthase [Thermosipho melanesiensis BI429]APT73102.1 (4Fe-4S)-binding protein [Thermosipho melanesiensis]OOC38501.1 (4Fe-4S)-binding protein [Thermosipho melanesiensis]OOC40305.1 (4Fe-4S)-binding protein [Thermosipho melanesiensis]OOC40569.1 (4Fe-4S)-binding protein [Thermosipho melanesiensis]